MSTEKLAIETSPEALQRAKTVLGLTDEDPLTLDDVLACAVLGTRHDVEMLQKQCQPGVELTLERIRESLFKMAQEHSEVMHRIEKMAARPQTPSHTVDDCAQVLLSCCPTQVGEFMEIAMEATAKHPWEIIAATLIMWHRDLIGGDFTEVRPPLTTVTRAATSQPPQTTQSYRMVTEGVIQLPLCETCQQPFRPPSGAHRPRFGCPACGEVDNIRKKNALELKRAAENVEYRPTQRPETLEYVMYTLGFGPCACGQVAESTP
jgi:predicted RNA-binding Zn-ribbon protein involved in translation (DUF1610 family)